MQKIKVSFLYSSSSRKQAEAIRKELWSLNEIFIENSKKKYPYLEKPEWIEVENEKFKQSLDFIYECQIWVVLVTSDLITFSHQNSAVIGLDIINKICIAHKNKKIRIVVPVRIKYIDNWDSLPLSVLGNPIDATKIKMDDYGYVATQIREAIQPYLQLIIFEQESEQLCHQVDYSSSLDDIVDSINGSLKKLEQNICELDDKSFPNGKILARHDEILEVIRHKKIAFDKRKSEKQRELEELFNFDSVEWPFEWDPAPYFPWIVGIFIFSIFVIMSTSDRSTPTDPTDHKNVTPKQSIVPLK
ncbi:MAG: hypothetical protein ACO31I_08545 [Prochlorotrichaceae cyanobacterium]|jgi:hypothetical protein